MCQLRGWCNLCMPSTDFLYNVSFSFSLSLWQAWFQYVPICLIETPEQSKPSRSWGFRNIARSLSQLHINMQAHVGVENWSTQYISKYTKLWRKHHSTVQISNSKLQVTGFWWDASRSLKSCKATSQAPPDMHAGKDCPVAMTFLPLAKDPYEMIWIPCQSRFLDVEKGLRIVLLKASTGALQTPESMLYQQKYRRPFSQALITALYVIRFRSSSLRCNSQKRPKAWLQITDCRVCVICCRFKAVRTGQFLRPVFNTIAIAISKYLTQVPTCSHSPLRAHALIAAL